MAQILPQALIRLFDQLGQLPGVGARTAERYGYYLLKNQTSLKQDLADALIKLESGVAVCPVTFALIDADESVSPIYADPKRNRQIIALVEEPLDIVAIERTGLFKGTYHVLGGVLSPIDDITPDKLHIKELLQRLKDDQVKELIIATNPSVEGESTALYVRQQIKQAGLDKLEISRLAQGIPIGTDLEYADQITLGHALEGRKTYED